MLKGGVKSSNSLVVRNLAFTIHHGVGFEVVDIKVMRRRVIFDRGMSMRRRVIFDRGISMRRVRVCAREGLSVLGRHGEAR